MLTRVKTTQEIDAMRQSGGILASVLNKVISESTDGMTAKDAANVAAKELKSLGGEPAFLNYQGFPNVICISVNEGIVHGIPSDYVFKSGDLVGFDFGVIYGGMITDSAVTIAIDGSNDPDAKRLLAGTEEAMMAGIKAVKGPTHVGDISAAAEAVMNRYGFGIIRDLVGHGVGHYLHEDPNIPNYGKAGTGMELLPGMTIAIEPMATLGGEKIVVAEDGWTINTADNSLAAQFEHTVLITDDGYEILTDRNR